MKLGALLVVVASCGGPQQPSTPAGATPSEPTAVTPTPTPTPTQASVTRTSTGVVNKRPDYSCFTYTSRNSTEQRTACMRSEDCGPYLDQAKQVGGIVEVSGCATAATVFCFTTGDEEVCQPTLDRCASERALLVRKGTPVQGDCTRI